MLFASDDGMLLSPETLETPAQTLVADIERFAPIHERLQEYLMKMIDTVTGRTAFPIVARQSVSFPLHGVDKVAIQEIYSGASQVHLLLDRLCSVRVEPAWHVPLVIQARANQEKNQEDYNRRILSILRFRAGLHTVNAFSDLQGGIIVPVNETDPTNISTLYESVHAIARDYGCGGVRLRISQFLREVPGRYTDSFSHGRSSVDTPNLRDLQTPTCE